MRFFATILLLASSASAIDIVHHYLEDCTGQNTVYRNVEPDQCISGGGGFRSASFNYIPSNWKLIVRTYEGFKCTNMRNQWHSNERTYICIDSIRENNWARYKSTGYSFNNLKRSDDVGEKDCKKPDLLVLEDGSTYDIAGLDDETVQVMKISLIFLSTRGCNKKRMEYSINGTTAADMPSAFDAYVTEPYVLQK